ncbi:MAG: dienelactone hydrolase family protein [Steroidobacteraceae bacterium]
MTSLTVTIHARDGGLMPAYLAMPEPVRAAMPVVIVLQEIFGVNANIRGIADGHAAQGRIAIAPDLFWRLRPGVDLDPSSEAAREEAMALMKRFDFAAAVGDIAGVAAYARRLPEASGKVGAVGYCLGGKLAFLASTTGSLDAAVSYYGTGIHASIDKAGEVRCPLLLHVALADHLCPPEAQAVLRGGFAPFADRVTIVEYPGVGHAFARRGAPSCDPPSADRADALTRGFLQEHLAGRR